MATPQRWRDDLISLLYTVYQYILTLSTGLLIQYSSSTIQYIQTHNVGRNYTHFPPTPAGLACLTFYNNILRVPTFCTDYLTTP